MWWPLASINESVTKFFFWPCLNFNFAMWWCTILLKVVLFVVFYITMRFPKKILRFLRKNRMSSSISLSHQWTLSSGQKERPRTVHRWLFERNYLWNAAAKKPWLTKAHISARLASCKQHQSWSFEQWSKVLFSDEMNIEVDNRKCRIMLRRLPSEKYHEDCIAKRTRAGSGPTGLCVVMSSDGLGIYKLFKGRLNQFFYCTSISWITT